MDRISRVWSCIWGHTIDTKTWISSFQTKLGPINPAIFLSNWIPQQPRLFNLKYHLLYVQILPWLVSMTAGKGGNRCTVYIFNLETHSKYLLCQSEGSFCRHSGLGAWKPQSPAAQWPWVIHEHWSLWPEFWLGKSRPAVGSASGLALLPPEKHVSAQFPRRSWKQMLSQAEDDKLKAELEMSAQDTHWFQRENHMAFPQTALIKL